MTIEEYRWRMKAHGLKTVYDERLLYFFAFIQRATNAVEDDGEHYNVHGNGDDCGFSYIGRNHCGVQQQDCHAAEHPVGVSYYGNRIPFYWEHRRHFHFHL